MTDRREAILARLLVIAAAVPGIKSAYRNKDQVSDLDRPAIIILDGDEEAEDDPHNRPADAPRRIKMRPEIYITASKEPANIGTELNGFRAAFYKAVVTDATLQTLILDGRYMRYLGCVTTLGRGRAAEGELTFHMELTYALKETEL